MRRYIVIAAACFAATLVGCGSAQTAYDDALAHVEDARVQLEQAHNAYSDCEVDLNTAEASGTVYTAFADANKHTQQARIGLDEAKAHIESAGAEDGDWSKLLAEFDGLLEAHEQLQNELWNHRRQLVVTGIAEVELPLTEGDVAGAFAGAAIGQPELIRMSTDMAEQNFRAMHDMLMEADSLEPEAHVDTIADYCDAELKVVALLERAADALEKGDTQTAEKLVQKADAMRMSNQDMPTAAIFEEGYADRIKPFAQHYEQHLATVDTLMGTVR